MDTLKSALQLLTYALIVAASFPIQASTLYNDDYWGAGASVECLSNGTTYCISGADVGFSGSTMTVTIHTDFAGEAGMHFTGTSTNTSYGMQKGIGYGDLFLASVYDPYIHSPDSVNPSFKGDNASNGTQWTYGLSFSTNTARWQSGNATGNASLYGLSASSGNPDALVSDDFMNISTANYRDGQEVAVDTSTASLFNASAGTWTVDDANNTITFSFDLAGTTLWDNLSSTGIAFHWAMTCANDAIEVDVAPPSSIPVPPSVWLMGTGLLGLVGIARRRKQA